MDSSNKLFLQILLIIFLTGLNAIFASAEMAMVSCNKNKIKKLSNDGDKRAKKLEKLLSDQTRFLSTIQVGITFANFFSSASAATSISEVLANKLALLNIPNAGSIAMVVITLILSYITLVFGELVPKRIALTNPLKLSMKLSGFIGLVSKIFYPFVRLLSLSTSLVLKITGKYSEDVEEKMSEEELKSYVKVSQEQGVINEAGEDMIINIMDFDDTLAYEVMTPRTSIYMIDYDEFSEKTIGEILEKGYSRIPVFRESKDNIVGVIYIKDLFIEYDKNSYKDISLDKILKEPYFVHENKKIDMLLKDLQRTRNYLALLVDEYGGFSGMVTVEDLVEEIVGEIEDEYDKAYPLIKKISDRKFLVNGLCEIDHINDRLDLKIKSKRNETMSGLMIELLGYIPKNNKNATVSYDDKIKLRAVNVKEKRIALIELKILDEE